MSSYNKKTKETTEKLRIIDDSLFRLISSYKGVCQEILRTLLDEDNLEVLEVISQETITSLHREIILDALCQLNNGRLCNIEVQKGSNNNDIKRVRFHTSVITANKTPKGTNFEDIPDVIIVYITEYDALDNNQAVTIIQRCQCVDDVYQPVMDGEAIIFANTIIKDDSEQSELLQLFLNRGVFQNEKYPALSEAINYFKETEDGETVMCELVESYARDYAKEYAEEYAKEVAKKMLRKNTSIEDIVEITGLSTDDVKNILESLNS